MKQPGPRNCLTQESLLINSPSVDNKDKPDVRDEVFADVQRELGFEGHTPSDSAYFVGSWTCTFRHDFKTWDDSSPNLVRSFHADGAAPAKAIDRSWEGPKDRWKFNDDQSFSEWTYGDPMPEFDIDEPTYTENRFHVLMRSPDAFVLFNGDGSLILIYLRARA